MAIQLVGVLSVFGILTPDQSGQLTKMAVPLGGLVAMGVSQFGYAMSRGLAKKEAPASAIKPLMTDAELAGAIKDFGQKEYLFKSDEMKNFFIQALKDFSKKETLL